MMPTVATMFAMLLLPAASLVTRPTQGCKQVSLLQQGADPADSKVIEGDDCGHVNTIIHKWSHAKKAGALSGSAKAAVMGAELAAKNTADAAKQATALGEKVGVDGKVPESVKLATEAATKAGDKATEAASTLSTTSDSFSGKLDEFAKAATDDDMVKIRKETEAAAVAAQDAVDAGSRALQKAAEAKDAAMKSSEGALKLIGSTVKDTTKLSEEAAEIGQKSTHATKDVAALVEKSAGTETKLDAKIAEAEEQAPVWEAQKEDLSGRKTAAEESKTAVETAITDLETAKTEMDGKTKTLTEVQDQAQGAPNAALGQSESIAAAEESMRKTETALVALKGKVKSMMEDSERLAAKMEELDEKLPKK